MLSRPSFLWILNDSRAEGRVRKGFSAGGGALCVGVVLPFRHRKEGKRVGRVGGGAVLKPKAVLHPPERRSRDQNHRQRLTGKRGGERERERESE